jgi:hypothetical protein
MIRPLTLISAALFVLSGAYLFAVKQRAQVLEDKLAQVAQATRLDQQRIRVLQAQWALEVDPSRLQQLATQFTTLQPMKPSQMVALPQLADALPAPDSPVPGSNPASPALPAGNDAGVVAQATASPVAATAAAQVHLASAELVQPQSAEPRTGSRVLAHEAVRRIPVSAGLRMASVEDQMRHWRPVHVVPHRVALARHVTESHLFEARAAGPLPAPGMPMGAQVLSVRAVAAPTPTPPLPQTLAEGGGSMLGMAQSSESGN